MSIRLAGLLHSIDRYMVMLCRAGLFAGFMVLMMAVLVQIIGRTFVHSSPVWTEELTRFALLYMTGFGTGLALRSGDLVNVDLVSEAMPKKISWLMRLISAVTVAGLCGVLLKSSWFFTSIGAMQTSPTMGVRMNLVHITMSLLLGLLMLFAVLRILLMLFDGHSGYAEREEQTGS